MDKFFLLPLAVKGGRLRNKFKFKPLPLVPCIEFKGLGGKAKRNVTMMQIFATLFQVVKYSFANRSVREIIPLCVCMHVHIQILAVSYSCDYFAFQI